MINVETIHKSKGKEADIVFILDIGKYPFLHKDNYINAIFGDTVYDSIEEERRVLYVGITRSKDKLYYISDKKITDAPGNYILKSFYNN